MPPTTITGAQLIARSLRYQGVPVVFGIVGIPVVEVAEACMEEGIRFIGFRNEQSASYAASAWGYLTGKPGVCLVVSGPGVVHALAGIVNAQVNNWPIIVLGGSCETFLEGAGAFQELDQVHLCRPYTKLSARPPAINQIPQYLERAFRYSTAGRPGPVYLDLPANYIQDNVDVAQANPALLSRVWRPMYFQADSADVAHAAELLLAAERPLVIVGKGAAYSRGERELLEFVEKHELPFLPTPMGKGVVPDSHPLCVAAARSLALAKADVIVLVGARLNWILHFGHRFDASAKIIQIDVHPEEIGNNRSVTVPLIGHIPLVVAQVTAALASRPLTSHTAFVEELRTKVATNVPRLTSKFTEDSLPMSYHRAFGEIRSKLPAKEKLVLVSEGANTMDIARSVFDFDHPRQRLDAGTFATMGVGLGFAIAAQLHYPDKRVVAIVGDSAFGFSVMELETAARARLPLVVVVINNNGIYHGLDDAEYEDAAKQGRLPSTALLPDVRYDLFAEAVGGLGKLVRTPEELSQSVEDALNETLRLTVINCLIKPGGRQKLEFAWMNK